MRWTGAAWCLLFGAQPPLQDKPEELMLIGTSLCMQLSNPASAAGLAVTDHTRYAVPWLPLWPSITAEANATVRSASPKGNCGSAAH